MSSYSGSSSRTNGSGYRSNSGARRVSVTGQTLPPPPPPSHHVQSTRAPPPSGIDHTKLRNGNYTRDSAGAYRGHSTEKKTPRDGAPMAKSHEHQHQHQRQQQQQPRPSAQKESVMGRNRHVRAPTAMEPEDAVTVNVSIVGVKFKCLVERDWPCESLVASAIAEYYLAYPTCEVPDCSVIVHTGRKETVNPKDPVGKWCTDEDEIELTMKDRPANVQEQRQPSDDNLNFHMYDFTIVFHRLPLGFTMKQEMDATVVANIYPKSAATHYDRLAPGVIVLKIGDTPLEFLGLRQVHELIRNCKIPLRIRFRGWKKPAARRSSFNGASDVAAANSNVLSPKAGAPPTATPTQRRKSVPSRPTAAELDDTASNSSGTRARASTTTAPAEIPALFDNASELTAQSAHTPSPYSQSKQRLSAERKKTNASSPYPEHRTVGAERRARRDSTGAYMDLSVPLADQLDTNSNQGDPVDSSPKSIADLKLKQKKYQVDGAPFSLTKGSENGSSTSHGNGSVNAVAEKFAMTCIGEGSQEAEDVRDCDARSNQNEDESEEMLVEHIKILQAELIQKHEEAKILATQLEKYHARLSAVQQSRDKKREKRPSVGATTTTSAPSEKPAVAADKPKLTLTPEMLEAMDSKAGLPPKGQYAGSNASSVSGYSNYSSRSAMARRHTHTQQLSRFVGKTGDSSNSLRGDASVSSANSANRRERQGSISFGDGLKSPRKQCVQNINNRYNYIPQTYSANDNFYDAPSSFSTKGGLISRSKATRDSYIKIADTPGVGAYDIKPPREKVRGGEIGDSDRSLPWP